MLAYIQAATRNFFTIFRHPVVPRLSARGQGEGAHTLRNTWQRRARHNNPPERGTHLESSFLRWRCSATPRPRAAAATVTRTGGSEGRATSCAAGAVDGARLLSGGCFHSRRTWAPIPFCNTAHSERERERETGEVQSSTYTNRFVNC